MTADEVIERFEHETPMGLKPSDGVRRWQLFTRDEVEVLVGEVRKLRHIAEECCCYDGRVYRTEREQERLRHDTPRD